MLASNLWGHVTLLPQLWITNADTRCHVLRFKFLKFKLCCKELSKNKTKQIHTKINQTESLHVSVNFYSYGLSKLAFFSLGEHAMWELHGL